MSAHDHLAALAFAQEHGKNMKAFAVPPEKGLSNPADMPLVLQTGTGLHVEPGRRWCSLLSGSISYNIPLTIEIAYTYELEHPVKHTVEKATLLTTLTGPFSRADVGLLFGTLSAGLNYRFIPEQVGLPSALSLPEHKEWIKRSQHHHPWHHVKITKVIDPRPGSIPWCTLRPLFAKRNLAGFDPDVGGVWNYNRFW